MSNVKIKPVPPLTAAKSSTSGHSNSEGSNSGDKDNHNGEKFQEVYKRKKMLSNQSQTSK